MTAKQGAHEIIEIGNEGRRESVARVCARVVRKLIGERGVVAKSVLSLGKSSMRAMLCLWSRTAPVVQRRRRQQDKKAPSFL